MAAIETRLKTISGLRTAPQKSESVTPPMAVVVAPDFPDYRETMGRGKLQFEVRVDLVLSASVARVGQQKMATYSDRIGVQSIPLAIEGDRTLGGTVDDCIVVSFVNRGIDEIGGLPYLVGEFMLRVIAPGV